MLMQTTFEKIKDKTNNNNRVFTVTNSGHAPGERIHAFSVKLASSDTGPFVVEVPYLISCDEPKVDRMAALLYAHYLLSRSWLIFHRFSASPHVVNEITDEGLQTFVETLNHSLKMKIRAIANPFP